MARRTTSLVAAALLVLTACTGPTEIDPDIPAPEFFVPTSGEVALGSPTALRWTAVPEAATYSLEIRRVDSQGTSIENRFSERERASLVFRVAGNHRVRIRALDQSGRGGLWSGPLLLTVVDTGPRFVD